MKPQEREEILQALKARFEKRMHRHKGIACAEVRGRLDGNPDALKSHRDMGATGGENKPGGSAGEMAAETGINLLTEEQYQALQKPGDFDANTSNWVSTPPDASELGEALCDRPHGKVFVHHNGAQSYYAARGFRGSLDV